MEKSKTVNLPEKMSLRLILAQLNPNRQEGWLEGEPEKPTIQNYEFETFFDVVQYCTLSVSLSDI